MINIDCIYTDRGAWCKNKNIKRSVFGLGARCCIEYPLIDHSVGVCKYKEEPPKSKPSPCPPKSGKVLPIYPWPSPPRYKNSPPPKPKPSGIRIIKGGKEKPTPPPSVRRKEREQPKKNLNHEIIDDKLYTRPIDKESVNLFVELVEERVRKLRHNKSTLNDYTKSWLAIKQIQKEINNE